MGFSLLVSLLANPVQPGLAPLSLPITPPVSPPGGRLFITRQPNSSRGNLRHGPQAPARPAQLGGNRAAWRLPVRSVGVSAFQTSHRAA